ncbi:acylphosphatase [Candidatus Neomarinimicrobiota bacterium]
MKKVHIIVSGRVQGVGFRWSAKRKADQLGLPGYVRNQADGRVEIVAEGPVEAVEQLIAWARRGPSFSEVSHIDVTELPAQGSESEFSIRR